MAQRAAEQAPKLEKVAPLARGNQGRRTLAWTARLLIGILSRQSVLNPELLLLQAFYAHQVWKRAFQLKINVGLDRGVAANEARWM